MSEAALHMLTQRMQAGKRAKAARGALGMRVPMGSLRQPSGDIVQDPDEQAQAVVARIFDPFERQGTIHGVLRSLVRHHIRVPHRMAVGMRKGE